MPAYIKIDGLDGPITYDGTKGWFELQSVQVTEKVDEDSGKRTGGGELTARKAPDLASWNFFQSLTGPIKEVTIVYLGGDRNEPLQEFTRITLSGAKLSHYHIEAGRAPGSASLETFTLTFTKITYKKGSPAHASRMVRPEDWGSIQAAKLFGQSALA